MGPGPCHIVVHNFNYSYFRLYEKEGTDVGEIFANVKLEYVTKPTIDYMVTNVRVL